MNQLVCVRTFANRAIAEIARGVLSAEGIEATVSAEDTAYDIALAAGGARLLVAADAAAEAREILARLHPDQDDDAPVQPMRIPLKALLVETSIAALAATGFAYHGLAGGFSLAVSGIFAAVGFRVLRSLDGLRPARKPFVGLAGLGLIAYGLAIATLLLSGLLD